MPSLSLLLHPSSQASRVRTDEPISQGGSLSSHLNPGELLAPDSDHRLFHALAYVSWQPSRASVHDCGNRARAWHFRAQSDEDHASAGASGMDRNHKREKWGDAAGT